MDDVLGLQERKSSTENFEQTHLYFTNLDLAEMDSLTKLHFGVRSCGVAILPNNMAYLL